ncbi:aminoacylase [Marchantia polymorpha subsp. ruderalis]|uniref:N-acyl-aliphatic-L-amino acid amidohydrolase n=2 Tax=Marchantia polymorpha TaxID=3197 RepID=A0AAF6BJU0_MARPO|nr:hypothetical protein MARPO_0073s0072 [Marchantia polymorpha]BBN12274.1 hypothetical protein Mp_5g18680 [Marchantia polymorpha subsp. ruderalis]|eukprot:PTQ35201.1 hypothetical protein MARPO_0073s0072 [Marchantia polymorpha]
MADSLDSRMDCVHLVGVLLLALLSFSQLSTAAAVDTEQCEWAVTRFQDYLRIRTVHPTPDYLPVTKFLIQQAQSLSLDSKILEFAPSKPIVLMTWTGTDPELASVMFNSHTDVVPVELSKWKHPPFAAHMDDEGNIFARGSQDMKSVGMQYLEAVRNLMDAGFVPLRSVHFSYVPDEEVGGADGAEAFVESHEFEELDVAVVVDEGMASMDDSYRVFNREKILWSFVIKAVGSPGHGSRLFEGMAVDNLREALNRVAAFRERQLNVLKAGEVAEGDVVSINNVFLKAGTPTPTGFVMNMQPSQAEAGFDMRLPPEVDADALEKLITEEWAPASHNLSVHFVSKQQVRDENGKPLITSIEDSNPWWVLLKNAITQSGGKLHIPETRTGASDCRFSRRKGIPAFGFSPMSNTPNLMHAHDEFLNVEEYLKGIKVYEEIIKAFSGPHDADGHLDTSRSFCEKLRPVSCRNKEIIKAFSGPHDRRKLVDTTRSFREKLRPVSCRNLSGFLPMKSIFTS